MATWVSAHFARSEIRRKRKYIVSNSTGKIAINPEISLSSGTNLSTFSINETNREGVTTSGENFVASFRPNTGTNNAYILVRAKPQDKSEAGIFFGTPSVNESGKNSCAIIAQEQDDTNDDTNNLHFCFSNGNADADIDDSKVVFEKGGDIKIKSGNLVTDNIKNISTSGLKFETKVPRLLIVYNASAGFPNNLNPAPSLTNDSFLKEPLFWTNLRPETIGSAGWHMRNEGIGISPPTELAIGQAHSQYYLDAAIKDQDNTYSVIRLKFTKNSNEKGIQMNWRMNTSLNRDYFIVLKKSESDKQFSFYNLSLNGRISGLKPYNQSTGAWNTEDFDSSYSTSLELILVYTKDYSSYGYVISGHHSQCSDTVQVYFSNLKSYGSTNYDDTHQLSMIIKNNNVGIGTESPDRKLDVNGNIRCHDGNFQNILSERTHNQKLGYISKVRI